MPIKNIMAFIFFYLCRKRMIMDLLDWIQTICAVISLFISLYATNEVRKIKKSYKTGDISNKTEQSIKGNNNNQSAQNTINMK